MRVTKPLLATAAAAALLAAGLSAVPSSAAPSERRTAVEARAQATLRQAEATLSRPSSGLRDVSMTMRDIAVARPHLSGADADLAARLLARPTNGNESFPSANYTVAEATPLCSDHVCVHYVTSTDAAPPLTDADSSGIPDYVETVSDTMEHVYDTYLDAGYRAPVGDGTLGGNAKSDVYLANVRDDGIYGYCTSDQPGLDWGDDAWAYCVLDDDFVDFPTPPLASLKVTAAHEFFHAVQFGYDITDDSWLMEATATWAEDEVYPSINDNLQYLPTSVMKQPKVSLDTWNQTTIPQYGDWIYFRYLTEKYDAKTGSMPKLVRQIWQRADSADAYSLVALEGALKATGTSTSASLADFALRNLHPKKFYDEGQLYPTSPKAGKKTFSKSSKSYSTSVKRNHLATASYVFTPKSLKGAWKLRIKVDGPPKSASPVARVATYKTNGKVAFTTIKLDGSGAGSKKLGFASADVKTIELTLANGSSRYDCWLDSSLWANTCYGLPKDENKKFELSAKILK